MLQGGLLQSALRAIRSESTAAVEPQQQQQPALQGTADTPAKPPWTPTRLLQKRNFLPRRMGHLMQVCARHKIAPILCVPLSFNKVCYWQVLEQEQVDAAMRERRFPDFRAGDVLQIRLARRSLAVWSKIDNLTMQEPLLHISNKFF